MIYNAVDIAIYVINKSNKLGCGISNLKLQKIMYYIQAAFLVEKKCPCYQEEILAWEYGPVVKEVYDEFKVYGRDEIPMQRHAERIVFDEKSFGIKKEKVDIDILQGDERIINKVIKAYEGFDDPFQLVRKTHKEKPWIKGRDKGIISIEDIKSYYSDNIDKLYGE